MTHLTPFARHLVAVAALIALGGSVARAQPGTKPLDSAYAPVVLTADWRPASDTLPARLIVGMRTTKEFGCYLHLVARVAVQDSVIALRRFRVQAGGMCPDGVGPASGQVETPLAPGSYVLEATHLGRTERWTLSLAPDVLRLTPRGETGTVARVVDTLAWLAPARAFVVRCGVTAEHRALCDDLYRAVEAVPGVDRLTIPPEGRNPFGEPAPDVEARYYRYATEAAREHAETAMRSAHAAKASGAKGSVFALTTIDGRTTYAMDRP